MGKGQEEIRMIKDQLYAPLEVSKRQGRGGVYPYVTWQAVADRMNEVFGSCWSSSAEYNDVINGNVIVKVTVCVYDPETNQRFCQDGFGGAPLDERAEAGNPFKSAYSKAFKDACKKWGVGLHLDEEGGSVPSAPANIPTPTAPAQPQVPSTPQPSIPTPTAPAPVEEPAQSVAPTQAVPQVPVQPQTPSVPVIPSVPSAQAAQSMVVGAPPEPQTPAQPAVPTIPSTPTMPSVPTATTALSQELPMTSNIGGGAEMISDVQLAALTSILSKADVSYEELAAEAFSVKGINKAVPPKEELTYEEGVVVVKYGNDKFRKHQ
jgi:hypothetical protein